MLTQDLQFAPHQTPLRLIEGAVALYQFRELASNFDLVLRGGKQIALG
jgi:hypothetical protein